MRPAELDLMVDVVEETTALLQGRGLLRSARAAFLFSRFLEYGLRGYSVRRVAELLGAHQNTICDECVGLGLPHPWAMMDLGMGLGLARICVMNRGRLCAAARRLWIDPKRAGRCLERCFGLPYACLKEKAWEDLLEEALVRRWPGEPPEIR